MLANYRELNILEELEQIILDKADEIEDLIQELDGIISDIGEEIADYVIDNDISLKTKPKRKAFLKEILEPLLDNTRKSSVYIKGEIDRMEVAMKDVLSE